MNFWYFKELQFSVKAWQLTKFRVSKFKIQNSQKPEFRSLFLSLSPSLFLSRKHIFEKTIEGMEVH